MIKFIGHNSKKTNPSNILKKFDPRFVRSLVKHSTRIKKNVSSYTNPFYSPFYAYTSPN